MNLKGKQTFQADAQAIWNILMDTNKLAAITPGISKLERIGDDQFNATSDIKIGPVKGSFSGDLSLVDKQEPNAFTLKIKQESKIGNADATVQILINEIDDSNSELSFDGNAKLSGTLARTGQRVLTGVAGSLTKQFFKGLEKELDSMQEATLKGKVAEEPVLEAKKPQNIFVRFLRWLQGLFKSDNK